MENENLGSCFYILGYKLKTTYRILAIFFPFFHHFWRLKSSLITSFSSFQFLFVEISPKTARVSFGLAEKDRLAETSTEQ